MKEFYLSLKEIQENISQIEAEFNTLWDNKRIITREKTNQWLFFKHCFDLLLAKKSDFSCRPERARDHKHEITKKLNFFKDKNRDRKFNFALLHESKLPQTFNNYPTYHKYALVISNSSFRQEVLELLERRTEESVQVEFEFYEAILTDNLSIKQERLKIYFDENGAAYEDMMKTLSERSRKEHTLQVPDGKANVSTKQVKDIIIVELDNDTAIVEARVYMYLKWWSVKNNRYAKNPYQEEQIITYRFAKKGGSWIITDMIYPEKNPKKLLN